jgi:hypothetical protein
MNAGIRCLAASLLILACSGVAFSQANQNQTLTYKLQTELGQWGDNVLVTCVLTGDQSLGRLFSTEPLSTLVSEWKGHFEATPVAVQHAAEISATLTALVQAFAADPTINWTAQDVLRLKWADLPGNTAIKAQIRAAFVTLKADGLTCLSFLNRSETEEAPQELVTAMVNVLANPRLSLLTNKDLYGTCSAGGNLTDSDMDLFMHSLIDVPLIRTDLPNAPQAKAGLSCCSRATRKCVGSTSGCCNMCCGGASCCLGSAWCP